MLIALSTQLGMSISQLDITSAYLHGSMDVDVYMEVPEFLEEMLHRILRDKSVQNIHGKAKIMLAHFRQGRRICLLKRALYRLRQAGRQWHSKLCEALSDTGLTTTNADPCVHVNKKGTVFLLVYVDILIASRDYSNRKDVMDTLKRWFAIKNLGEAKYCLGIEITRTRESISLSQSSYIRNLLVRFGMVDCKGANTPLTYGFKPLRITLKMAMGQCHIESSLEV